MKRIFFISLVSCLLIACSSFYADAGEVTIVYEVDDQGGLYYLDGNSSAVRFDEFVEFIDSQDELKKVVLIAERKTAWNEIYGKEYFDFFAKSRRDLFVIEMRKLCNSCPDCANGFTKVIFDYKSNGIEITLDKKNFQPGEKINYNLVNDSSFEQNFHGVGVEYFEENEWKEMRFNIMCQCLTKCDGAWFVESGKALEKHQWDQKLFDCSQAKEGKYRIVINLSTYTDEFGCAHYNSVVYSDEFMIEN